MMSFSPSASSFACLGVNLHYPSSLLKVLSNSSSAQLCLILSSSVSVDPILFGLFFCLLK